MLMKDAVMLLQLSRFEQAPWARFLLPLAAGAALAAAYHGEGAAAPAQPPHAVYVLSDAEGYGLADCIAQRRECGQIVADSWCEAHGHARALAFGAADDVTGAISLGASKPAAPAGAAMVSCAD
ncbi:MAG TPA: hypothetical protein VEH76_12925 [Methylocystis sp.]|nr:hypothetical protein [Methylocystis sp.]